MFLLLSFISVEKAISPSAAGDHVTLSNTILSYSTLTPFSQYEQYKILHLRSLKIFIMLSLMHFFSRVP